MKIIISALLILLFFSNSLLSKDWVYFVVPGDNIWAISERFLTKTEHYEAVQRMNNIQFPRRMQPGTVLRIPLDWVAQQASKVKVSFIKGSALKVSKGQQTVTNQSTEFGLGDELRLDRMSHRST